MTTQDSDPTQQPDSNSPTGSDENSGTSSTTGAASGTDAASRQTPTGKKKPTGPPVAAGVERVGNSYRLTQDDDWGIRYAALMLERQDGNRRTQQDLVDQAVREFLDKLRKKGIQLPETSR